MHIEKRGRLYNVHPSIYVDQHTNLALLKKILDISIEKRLPFHIWFHLWNFGQDTGCVRRSISNIFTPIIDYAKRKEDRGVLAFETMLSAAEKAGSSLNL
jgi:hypothetical protein